MKIMASIIAVLCSNIVVAAVRFTTFKDYMKIKVEYKNVIICISAVLISLVCYYCCSEIFNAIYFVILTIFAIVLYKDLIVSMLKMVLDKIKKQ